MTWEPAKPICLDVSNYQPEVIPSSWWDLGVRRLIVGCQSVEFAVSQVQSGRALGMQVEDLYSFGTTVDADDVTGGTSNTLEVANTVGGISTAWIDCERDSLTVEEIRLAKKQLEDAGLKVGIYTGPYYWRDHLGNTCEFVECPLWLADYFWSGLPWPAGVSPKELFGLPWETLAAHQYTTSGSRNDNAPSGITPQLGGIRVDYNVIYREEAMTVDELNTAIMNREKLRSLASGDYEVVLKSLAVLRSAGIIV